MGRCFNACVTHTHSSREAYVHTYVHTSIHTWVHKSPWSKVYRKRMLRRDTRTHEHTHQHMHGSNYKIRQGSPLRLPSLRFGRKLASDRTTPRVLSIGAISAPLLYLHVTWKHIEATGTFPLRGRCESVLLIEAAMATLG